MAKLWSVRTEAERRRSARVAKHVPINLLLRRGTVHVAMTADVSESGVLFGTPHHLEVGQEISIGGPCDHPRMLARIVRLRKNYHAQTPLWLFHVAVTFVLRTPPWLLD